MNTQFYIHYKFNKLGYTKASNTWHVDKTSENIEDVWRWFCCGSRVEVVRIAYGYNNHGFYGTEKITEYYKSRDHKHNLKKEYLIFCEDVNASRDKHVKHEIYEKLINSVSTFHKDNEEEKQKAIQKIENYEKFLQGVALGNTSMN